MGNRVMINEDLLTKIEARRAHVAIVGLGYVGLPLAVAFTNAGHDVVALDTDADVVVGPP